MLALGEMMVMLLARRMSLFLEMQADEFKSELTRCLQQFTFKWFRGKEGSVYVAKCLN